MRGNGIAQTDCANAVCGALLYLSNGPIENGKSGRPLQQQRTRQKRQGRRKSDVERAACVTRNTAEKPRSMQTAERKYTRKEI
jgi:hypothetical protein